MIWQLLTHITIIQYYYYHYELNKTYVYQIALVMNTKNMMEIMSTETMNKDGK